MINSAHTRENKKGIGLNLGKDSVIDPIVNTTSGLESLTLKISFCEL